MSGCLRFILWLLVLYAIAWVIEGGWVLLLVFVGVVGGAVLLLLVLEALVGPKRTKRAMRDSRLLNLVETKNASNSGYWAVSERYMSMTQEEKKREEVQIIQAYRKQQAIEQAKQRPSSYAAGVLQKESFHVLSPIILKFAPEFVTVTSDSKSVVYGYISPDAEVIVFECYSCSAVKRMYYGEDFCIEMFPGLISDMRFLGLSDDSTVSDYVQIFLENRVAS